MNHQHSSNGQVSENYLKRDSNQDKDNHKPVRFKKDVRAEIQKHYSRLLFQVPRRSIFPSESIRATTAKGSRLCNKAPTTRSVFVFFSDATHPK
jgi:hypothetical protein